MKVSKQQLTLGFLSIAATALTYVTPNAYQFRIPLGILMIALSVFSIISYRKCGRIVWVIGICAICNISWAYSVCFIEGGQAFSKWQLEINKSREYIILIKCVALFYLTMLLGVGSPCEALMASDRSADILGKAKVRNNLVYFGGFAILLYILLFGFTRGAATGSGYTSQTNPIYEYAIVIFIMVWYYTRPEHRIAYIALVAYAAIYIVRGVLRGDRSSAFPMIILLVILLRKRETNMLTIIIFGLAGILLGNAIDLFRNNNLLSIYTQLLNTGFTVNTLTYSHYAGVQIIRFSESRIHLAEFFQYFKGIVLGGATQLSVIARQAGYYNAGAGFSATFFYYWFGYIGVALGGYAFGRILRAVFTRKTFLSSICEICVIAFTLRWYVYFPAALLRTALLIPILVGWLCSLISKRIKLGTVEM